MGGSGLTRFTLGTHHARRGSTPGCSQGGKRPKKLVREQQRSGENDVGHSFLSRRRLTVSTSSDRSGAASAIARERSSAPTIWLNSATARSRASAGVSSVPDWRGRGGGDAGGGGGKTCGPPPGLGRGGGGGGGGRGGGGGGGAR